MYISSVIFLLVATSASAHSHDLARAKCEALVGLSVERVAERDDEIRWTPEPGLGPRGFKSGAWPAFDAANDRNAKSQLVFAWHHELAVARSVEEARAHDAPLIPYKQMMYLVTDGRLDDLEPTKFAEGTPPVEEIARRSELAHARAAELLRHGRARVVWFSNPEFEPDRHLAGKRWGGLAPLTDRETGSPVPRRLEDVDPALVRAALHPDEMGVVRDQLGTRFVQDGWFLPPWRGIMSLEETFRLKPGGKTPESGEVKKAYDLLRRLVRLGWRIHVNHDLDEVLALEKATIHNVNGQTPGDDGGLVPNSRFLDPHVEAMTRAAFAAGDAFTFELRDPSGILYAASIGYVGPNRLLMGESIGGRRAPRAPNKENPEGGWIEEIVMRKALVAGQIVWSRMEMGYPFIDSQVVSTTTAQMKCHLVPAREFREKVFAGPAPARGQSSGIWTPPEYEAIYRAIDEGACR